MRMKLFVMIMTLLSCADHCCGERRFIPGCGKFSKPPLLRTIYMQLSQDVSVTCCILNGCTLNVLYDLNDLLLD